MDKLYDFGMIGIGVMGRNLLLNIADHGFSVIGYNKDPLKTGALEKLAEPHHVLIGKNHIPEFVASLKKPRRIMMLVPAGKPVDSVIESIKPHLEEGDILIDGGNSHFSDTLRRVNELKGSGFHFIGMGISGGEEGARRGPSIMPGGDVEAWKALQPILEAVAAKVNGEPCVAYLGKGAAGHYVKMVHNGIEYGIMQLISECYDLMRHGLGLDHQKMHEVFKQWDSGEMKSFLLEITADIMKQKDELTGGYLVDYVSDRAGAKGTGKWTSLEGLQLPVPIPNIDVAVMMRNLSSMVEERKEADHLYRTEIQKIEIDPQEFTELLHDTLYFATIMTYAQGLAMISVASKEMEMDIPMQEVLTVWRGGCIIRSAILDVLKIAYKDKELKNILLDKQFAEIIQKKLPAIQKVVSLAGGNNFTLPGIMSALNYFNAYRRAHLPTNLVQAQRDYFGAHTYERTDREGTFHSQWNS